MKAKLKEMYSLELEQPLEEFWPEDKSNFGISIRLMIGAEGSSGAESFDIFVCTPDWIKSQYPNEKCMWGRHMLVILEYDLHLIRQAVDCYIAGCTGEDWPTIARKLSGMGAWEFEDYQS
jgi:hypothetical protein